MPNVSIETAQTVMTNTQPDMSMWGLFWQADFVVKLVMLTLVLASIWSWAVFIDKFMKLRVLNKQADDFESAFWGRESLSSLLKSLSNGPQTPLEALYVSALTEWNRLKNSKNTQAVLSKIERAMGLTYSREIEALGKNMGYLATVASISVFVGLFGTVWGIIDSFQSIATSKNTNLTVVAPGIAEALFATALGLVAAIPARLFYNNITSQINRYSSRMDMFAGELQSAIDQEMEKAEGL